MQLDTSAAKDGRIRGSSSVGPYAFLSLGHLKANFVCGVKEVTRVTDVAPLDKAIYCRFPGYGKQIHAT